MTTKAVLRLVTWTALMVYGLAVSAGAQEPLEEAISEYLGFANYEQGIILPQQLTEDIFQAVDFVDTRDADQFNEATIPGARNIEWREIVERRDEIDSDKKTVLFCNTGSLSAQALFALRLLGYDNAVVLQTGFLGWQENGAYKPATP